MFIRVTGTPVQPLISLAADNPTQQLIDQQLAKAGIVCPRETVVNLLDTQIALVEANEGIAVIPSLAFPWLAIAR